MEMGLPIAVHRMGFDLFHLTPPGFVIHKFHLRMWQLRYPGYCFTMYILAEGDWIYFPDFFSGFWVIISSYYSCLPVSFWAVLFVY